MRVQMMMKDLLLVLLTGFLVSVCGSKQVIDDTYQKENVRILKLIRDWAKDAYAGKRSVGLTPLIPGGVIRFKPFVAPFNIDDDFLSEVTGERVRVSRIVLPESRFVIVMLKIGKKYLYLWNPDQQIMDILKDNEEILDFSDIYPEEYYQLPQVIRNKAKIVFIGEYFEGLGPCIPRGDIRVRPLITAFNIEDDFFNKISCKQIHISEAMLPVSKYVSIELEIGKKYLVLLNPDTQTMKIINEEDRYFSCLHTLKKDEIIAIIELN